MNRVVPAADVVTTAVELADRIIANTPSAVRAARALVRGAADATKPGLGPDRAGRARLIASGDAIEGATAFVEKRQPVWNDDA